MKNRTLFCRDNIDVLRGINSNSIDLVYLDPPFNKKKTFHAPTGSSAAGASFRDIWSDDDVKEGYLGVIADLYPRLYQYLRSVDRVSNRSNRNYLAYMAERLVELQRILKPSGSIYLHCDNTMSHYLKVLMDTIFGERNFRNEIVWNYQRWTGATKHFQRMHDALLFYAKSNSQSFNLLKEPYSPKSKHKGARFTTVEDGKLNQEYTEDESRLKAMRDVWDISIINSQAKERVGYPTQKPLALLERIIKASSNAGDIVLDPFCGCATTCVAAEKLDRQWIGIDVSKKAYDLVKIRLDKEVKGEDNNGDRDFLKYQNTVIYRTDTPARTDVTALDLSYKRDKIAIKHILYDRQNGACNGCKVDFDYRHLEIDHIIPRTKGGGEQIDNLQLLCPHCNRIKGTRSMQALLAYLKEHRIGIYQS